MPQIHRYSVKTLLLIGLCCAIFSIAAITITSVSSFVWYTTSVNTLAEKSVQHATAMAETATGLGESVPNGANVAAKMDQLKVLKEKSGQDIAHEKQNLLQQKYQILFILVSVAFLSLIVFAFGVGLLSRAIMPSISQFLSAFEEYNAGELSYRLADQYMPKELHRVANGFNSMAHKLQQSYAQLAYQTMNDEMTGVYNRRRFIVDLEGEVKRAKRYKRTLSLMLVDMDNFKDVNSQYGNEVGDQVLCKTVDFIYKCIRDTDNLYRYGGEEFAVILVEISDQDADMVADRIRQNICNNPIALANGINVQTSASFGIANFPDNSDNEVSLIHAADEALFRAKEQGKNQVVHTREFVHQAKAG